MAHNTTSSHLRRLGLAVSALAMVTVIGAWPMVARSEEPKPFRISVDGVAIDGSGTVTDESRKTDVDLEAVDIRVTFDGLGANPILNVSTMPIRASYKAGDDIRFLTSLNYPAFVERGEIRIFERGDHARDRIYTTLDVVPGDVLTWRLPDKAPARMEYVFRVYDKDGRYDETKPLPLRRVTEDFADHEPADAAVAPGYGEDRTAIRNITVSGGAVTIHGSSIPGGHKVAAFGEPIPVDGSGAFVVQRLLPTGTHDVEISVLRDGQGLWFNRDVEIPRSEWFYVALADLTAGYRWGSKNIESVKPGEFDDVYTRGRLAFYVKGKIKGRYLLTAAADTGDGKIENLFQGLDAKDPRQFLSRIDPDDYYPVYGDDSSAIEDAPTRGKFYVRLERGPSHVMWGNFRSNITGTEFLRNNRALYGASGVYRSEAVTGEGEAQTALDVYAAQPGTLPQHDVFRGTGGSAYFLKFQDITPGSETITIETRNATTGWVVARRTLKDGDDYDLDYIQGVLLLRNPVPSTGPAGTENFVVADYEFTPASGEVDGYVVGGRAQQWLGDHVRTGVTGMTDKTGKSDQILYGADLRVQATPRTFVEGEVARSEGPGFGSTYSADGGLTLQDTPTAGAKNRSANAWRVNGRADMADLTGGRITGHVSGRYEHFDRGFSTRDNQVREEKQAWGTEAEIELSSRVKTKAAYSEQRVADGTTDREMVATARIAVDDHVRVEPFARYTNKERAAAVAADNTGERGDLGVRITHAWDEHTEVYVFGQGTVAVSGTRKADHRGGIGGKRQISEKVDVEAEVSYGSLGIGAAATIGYAPTADDRYYVGYRLDPEREWSASWPYDLTGNDLGSIVAGARHRFSDQWLAYAEDNYDMFGERQSLTQIYGVTYTPDARWTVTGGLEVGQVFDNTINPDTGLENPDFDRQAISLSAVFRGEEGIDLKAKGELRFDDSEDNTRDLTSYLFQLAIGVKVSEDWRALASVDAVFSDATTSTRDGEYLEASAGFAYRPAEGDRLNALAKYTYLYDLPGADQVTVDGTTSGPYQRSHIASIDVSYDLTEKLTLGAKYGVRLGEQRDRAPGSSWDQSLVQLGILRADLHVVHNWDLLIEGRALWNTDTETVDLGALAAVYRHLGDNLKLGVGYNFGSFSDDLRDLVHDDQGVFINLIGKL